METYKVTNLSTGASVEMVTEAAARCVYEEWQAEGKAVRMEYLCWGAARLLRESSL